MYTEESKNKSAAVLQSCSSESGKGNAGVRAFRKWVGERGEAGLTLL